MTLRVYDSSGMLLRTQGLAAAPSAITAFSAGSNPWDPSQGALALSSGNWSSSFDGKDSNGDFLAAGSYLLELGSSGGGGTQRATLNITVLRSQNLVSSAMAWPNPAPRGATALDFGWAPMSQDVECRIYNQAGELMLELGLLHGGKGHWELKNASDGVYFVALKIPGERRPRLLKVALAR